MKPRKPQPSILQIEFKHDLIVLIAMPFALVLTIYVWPLPTLRIILGLLLVVLFPGYALVAALFPRENDTGDIARIALSFGLSVIIVPLIGLFLHFTHWGITREYVLFLVTLFIVLCSGIAHYRRSRLSPEARFMIRFEFDVQRWLLASRLDRLLSIMLALSVIAVVGAFIYAIVKPQVGERFTEFYILGSEGLAENYPRRGTVGQPLTVTVGIANQEAVPSGYQVYVISDELLIGESGPVHLEPGATDERPVSFTPLAAGDDVEVLFYLYRDGVEGPYRSLRLWLKVTETG
jgi:uncharacterized membrane protein